MTPDHVTVKVNDRQAVDRLLTSEIGLESSKVAPVLVLIDRMDKMGADKLRGALVEAGLGRSQADDLVETLGSGKKLRSPRLDEITEIVARQGFEEYIEFDPRIVRGFDYYTGTVFEAWAKP